MAAPEPLLVTLPGYEQLGAATGLETVPSAVERFANGELAIALAQAVEGHDCFLLGTVAPPSDQLVAFLLTADTLARRGARSVNAVLPYLAYARQDHPEPRRSLAAAWLGDVLVASGVVDVVSIDVHSEAARNAMGLPVASLSPASLFAAALAADVDADTVVVAPDGGALERSAALAGKLGIDRPVACFDKVRSRHGVSHERLVGDLTDKALVVDDILDTGGTLVSCCRELAARGVRETRIAVTHGLFTGSGWQELGELGVRAIHVTDSVPSAQAHASGLVHVHSAGEVLAEALPLAERGAIR